MSFPALPVTCNLFRVVGFGVRCLVVGGCDRLDVVLFPVDEFPVVSHYFFAFAFAFGFAVAFAFGLGLGAGGNNRVTPVGAVGPVTGFFFAAIRFSL